MEWKKLFAFFMICTLIIIILSDVSEGRERRKRLCRYIRKKDKCRDIHVGRRRRHRCKSRRFKFIAKNARCKKNKRLKKSKLGRCAKEGGKCVVFGVKRKRCTCDRGGERFLWKHCGWHKQHGKNYKQKMKSTYLPQSSACGGEKVNSIMKTKGKTGNYGNTHTHTKFNCLLSKFFLCVFVYTMIYNVYR